MATHDFGASYDEMETAAQKLRDKKGEIDEGLEEVMTVIDDLTSDGFKTENASGAYKDAVDELAQNIKEANTNVDEMADALVKMADMIRDTDGNMAGGGA
ncbi:hypothetical protein GCM10010915_02220 [Microbacterium faecale]|uniref:ESAT-6-like protein n=1 Tax=Microbacterium faecale TaxID=1804630 RepID=A0A917DCR0_9MICO|nr:WXG100 family type VII secretion target [Microbacterium faecale]GGD25740.1 hypothetical protein GCM10010915_02220 [Microbacterium faecale]